MLRSFAGLFLSPPPFQLITLGNSGKIVMALSRFFINLNPIMTAVRFMLINFIIYHLYYLKKLQNYFKNNNDSHKILMFTYDSEK